MIAESDSNANEARHGRSTDLTGVSGDLSAGGATHDGFLETKVLDQRRYELDIPILRVVVLARNR
jgi:hypothetical protein